MLPAVFRTTSSLGPSVSPSGAIPDPAESDATVYYGYSVARDQSQFSPSFCRPHLFLQPCRSVSGVPLESAENACHFVFVANLQDANTREPPAISVSVPNRARHLHQRY